MSRALTRQQALGWREAWSHSDKELIAYVLDTLGEADYYEPPSQTYVGARVEGRAAVYVNPGYLEFPTPSAVERVDPSRFPGGIRGDDSGYWYALSTFQHRGESTPAVEELTEPCPECWTVPSVSGECACD